VVPATRLWKGFQPNGESPVIHQPVRVLTISSELCKANYERIVEIEEQATPLPNRADAGNNPGPEFTVYYPGT
jgi:hypothetical protein